MTLDIPKHELGLSDLLEMQRRLQVESFGIDLAGMPLEARIAYVKENIFALEHELHEAADEVGWKSWATSRHFNRDLYVKELVDALHFLMNLFLATGADPDSLALEIGLKYQAKHAVNAQRQRDGYDGITGKCWNCKRAAEDVGTVRIKHDDDTDAVVCNGCGASLHLADAL